MVDYEAAARALVLDSVGLRKGDPIVEQRLDAAFRLAHAEGAAKGVGHSTIQQVQDELRAAQQAILALDTAAHTRA